MTRGSRSRVSSLTRSQVASIKSFATTFNFNSTNTIGRSTSTQYGNSPSKQHSGGSPAVSSRSQSMFSKSSGSPSLKGISKRDKSGKDSKRRSSHKRDANSTSSSSIVQSPTATSQWYTTPDQEMVIPSYGSGATTPVFELRQELTPKRPLRSEVERERRLSRPSSGQFPTSTRFSAITTINLKYNGGYNNRDSIGTTDSTASEEDAIPPPLPQKTKEPDYCNLPDDTDSLVSVVPPSTPRVINKPQLPEPVEHEAPPTPPPKKPSKPPV